MERRYASPSALEAAITSRARARATREASERALVGGEARDFIGQRINQLRRDVAFHAVLRRLSRGSAQGAWVVKGGVALQLRLDPSRPSKDIDVAWMGASIDRAAELHELHAALQHDEGDFFDIQLDISGATSDEDGALVLPLLVLLGGRRFERFTIDLAPDREGVQADVLERIPDPLGIEQLGTATVHVLQVELQLADKICAIHETRNGVASSRWRDLADIAMISEQIEPIDAARVAAALAVEVARRGATLPRGLPSALGLTTSQTERWTRSWGRGGRTVPLEFDAALALAQRFADPILSGGVRDGVWLSGKWRTRSGDVEPTSPTSADGS